VPYIIETATHTFSKSEGYRTQIQAKLYDGKSASEDKKNNPSGSAANDNKTTLASNAPSGTPATPNQRLGERRNGRTDEN